MKNKEIELPSDEEIADKIILFLEGIDRQVFNPAIFADILPGEKEALVLALRRAASCARNVRISLKGKTK